MFITFEGVEGSGKTTQAERLRQTLTTRGHSVWKTREPGGTPLAEAIRQVVLTPERAIAALGTTSAANADMDASPSQTLTPIAELLLMNAARAQLVQEIDRRLAGNQVVLCDRYADATLAYQGGGRGIPRGTLQSIIALAIGATTPDLTILLDLNPKQGLARKAAPQATAAEWNRMDEESLEFHQRVRNAYLALAHEEPARWLILDATSGVNALATRIWEAVEERL